MTRWERKKIKIGAFEVKGRPPKMWNFSGRNHHRASDPRDCSGVSQQGRIPPQSPATSRLKMTESRTKFKTSQTGLKNLFGQKKKRRLLLISSQTQPSAVGCGRASVGPRCTHSRITAHLRCRSHVRLWSLSVLETDRRL